MTMLNDAASPSAQDTDEPIIGSLSNPVQNWPGAPVNVIPTQIKLTWSQDMTLRSYSAARSLGGIAMEHFKDKPWLVPVYLLPSPIPGVKSWVIYAYMAAATKNSDAPDLVRLRGELLQALRAPANLEDLSRQLPEVVTYNEASGKADISYKSIFKTAARDIGIANKHLMASCIKHYPGLFVGLPMSMAVREADLSDIETPFRCGQRTPPYPSSIVIDPDTFCVK